MNLLIHDQLLIEEVQERFSKCFPGLKIEFYAKPHHWKKASKEMEKIDPNSKLADIRKNHKQGTLVIQSGDTAGRVEANFRRLFGLNVQVFRNENNAWIQTTSTDNYSLKEQMEFASKAKSSIIPEAKEQLDEYDFL